MPFFSVEFCPCTTECHITSFPTLSILQLPTFSSPIAAAHSYVFHLLPTCTIDWYSMGANSVGHRGSNTYGENYVGAGTRRKLPLFCNLWQEMISWTCIKTAEAHNAPNVWRFGSARIRWENLSVPSNPLRPAGKGVEIKEGEGDRNEERGGEREWNWKEEKGKLRTYGRFQQSASMSHSIANNSRPSVLCMA